MIENIEQAKKHLKEIIDFYKLNDENNYDYTDKDLISIRIVLKEIERLNNIIKELEKWLVDYIKLFDEPDMLEEQTCEDLKEVLDKLQELKGSSDKE